MNDYFKDDFHSTDQVPPSPWVIHEIISGPDVSMRYAALRVSYNDIFFHGTISQGWIDLAPGVSLTSACARDLYHQIVITAPDGLYLLPESEAIKFLL